MITGTSYFPSLTAAILYYRPYGFDRADVARKLLTDEIKIGYPPTADDERVVIIDNGNRYAVARDEPWIIPKAPVTRKASAPTVPHEQGSSVVFVCSSMRRR